MTIAALLNKLFFEKGPVKKIPMDNGTAFKSTPVKAELDRWNVQIYYRVACRSSGNITGL